MRSTDSTTFWGQKAILWKCQLTLGEIGSIPVLATDHFLGARSQIQPRSTFYDYEEADSTNAAVLQVGRQKFSP
jgi:hypothetical protein